MTEIWLIAACLLLPPYLIAVVAAGRGTIGARLVAIEFASSLTILLLVVLCLAFDQPSSIDLGIMQAVLGVPAILLFALVLERWL